MAPPAPSLGSLAVLLVEDDPTNQLIAVSMLRHLGVEADTANDGRAGVRHASQKSYDVVLMDIQMPVMDGVEAMKAIRALIPPERCPRILAVTAHAVSGTRERLLTAGFDGFYNKPLTISLLRAALEQSLPEEPLTMIMHAPTPNQATQEASASAAIVEAVRAHVREMLGEDDEEFVQDLARSFAESSHHAIGQIRASGGDPQAIAHAAHALKGSASNMGLSALTECWGVVETRIRTGDSEVGGAVDRALADTARTVEMLESVLG